MKLSCVRENLAKALGSLGRVVTTSGTLPVLGNIMLKTDQGRLKMSATDLEMGINFWVGAKIEQEGATTIPARIFTDYINNNADSQVDLVVDGQMISVNSEHYSTKINGLSAEEFPIIPEIGSESVLELTVEALRDAVSKVVFAASTGEANPTLGGVLFKVDQGNLKIVATDSYRLAEKIIPLGLDKELEMSVIVPTKTIQELNKLLSLSSGQVKVILGENQILFRMEDIEVVSRLIDGNYPAYESIMPANHLTKVVINTRDLLRDTKLAAVFARETQKIRLEINKAENKVKTYSKGQSGENVSSLQVEVEGIDGEITFNTRYLSDVLNVIGSSKTILELTDKLKPGLIKSSDDDNYRYIIMPVKN